MVHRVPEPRRPRDLDAFVAWVDRMNGDMLAAGVELADGSTSTSSTATTGWSPVAADTSPAASAARYVTTIHATEFGRHQGWVDKHPQSHIHAVEKWMARRADHVITCSHYMRGHVADIYGLDEDRITVIPNGIDPDDLQPGRRPRAAARAVRRAGRAAGAAGRPAGLREGLPARARRAARAHRAARQRAVPRRRQRHARGAAAAPRPSELGLDRARHVPGLDRRRRPALALPDRRPDGGAVDLRAVRARRAGGDGLGLPVHRGRHGRPARGRAQPRRRAALPRGVAALAGADWSRAC